MRRCGELQVYRRKEELYPLADAARQVPLLITDLRDGVNRTRADADSLVRKRTRGRSSRSRRAWRRRGLLGH